MSKIADENYLLLSVFKKDLEYQGMSDEYVTYNILTAKDFLISFLSEAELISGRESYKGDILEKYFTQHIFQRTKLDEITIENIASVLRRLFDSLCKHRYINPRMISTIFKRIDKNKVLAIEITASSKR